MTVALDKQVYIFKVNEILQDMNTYEVIEKDPTKRIITDYALYWLVRRKKSIYLIPYIEVY